MTDEPRARREDPGPLLARTLEIATAYLRALPERPVLVDQDVASLRAALVTALPETGEDPIAVIERLASDADPGIVSMAGTALLRLRHRRRGPCVARRRLADLDLGPERRSVLLRPGRVRRRGGRGCVAHRPARAARGHQLRPRLGLPDGRLHRPGCRPPCGPRGGRLGRRGEGPDRGARDRRGRRRRGAFDHRRRPAVPRPRAATGSTPRPPTARAGCGSTPSRPRSTRSRPVAR